MTVKPMPKFETGLVAMAPNVYAYLQYDGNWGISNAGLVVGEDEAVVIDALMVPSMTRALLAAIRKVTDKPISYLINTHSHGDHTSGNQFFRGARIVAHTNCRQEMVARWASAPVFQRPAWMGDDWAREMQQVRPTLPTITFGQRLHIHLRNMEIQLLHWGPGHSTGDCVVYVPGSRVAFIGDLGFFYCTPVAHASVLKSIAVLDEIAKLDADTFVPGHGLSGGREELMDVRRYLALVAQHGERSLQAGLSEEKAASSMDLGPYTQWGQWKERLLMNMRTLYRELRAPEP